jgi:hypothetical protein
VYLLTAERLVIFQPIPGRANLIALRFRQSQAVSRFLVDLKAFEVNYPLSAMSQSVVVELSACDVVALSETRV